MNARPLVALAADHRVELDARALAHAHHGVAVGHAEVLVLAEERGRDRGRVAFLVDAERVDLLREPLEEAHVALVPAGDRRSDARSGKRQHIHQSAFHAILRDPPRGARRMRLAPQGSLRHARPSRASSLSADAGPHEPHA